MQLKLSDLDSDRFADHVFQLLQLADCDTGVMFNKPSQGLVACRHPEISNGRWEESCSRRLSDALLLSRTEVHYPGSTQRCDLVIFDKADCRLWIEVKFAWKYEPDKDRLKRNPNFRKHLIGAAVDDVRKLELLTALEAKWTGILVIGFDVSDDPMTHDVNEFRSLSGLDSDEWREYSECWAAPLVEGLRTFAWFWIRRVPPLQT